MKRLCTYLAALLLPYSMAQAASADAYPAKAITIVYPYAPGSASDTMTRLLAESMSKRLGQPSSWTASRARAGPSPPNTSCGRLRTAIRCC
ncbi:hypothetical protein [Achromobacter spanius]|uniref:hypothetical protein n=1 Tax=Achromobacter spanius TaxID=217203 RepID=UPI001CB94607|nr:hypothetical protein [Achromobacter spanius]